MLVRPFWGGTGGREPTEQTLVPLGDDPHGGGSGPEMATAATVHSASPNGAEASGSIVES
jgi:hypothetical protein